MTVRTATLADLSSCVAIYNHWVAEGVATFDDQPWTLADGILWYEQHQAEEYPVLVLELDGAVAGFGTLSRWSRKSGYRRTAEVSLFLAPEEVAAGHGKKLLQKLVEAGQARGHHVLLARIEASNEGSVRLFRGSGFEPVGVMREVGFKNKRWLDVFVVEKLLSRRARV